MASQSGSGSAPVETTRREWRVVGKTVRGASHLRSGAPNQDAIGYLPESGAGLPLILAVSDGHGSAKSFRSDRGSRFAIATMLAEFAELLETAHAAQPAAIRRLTGAHLPQHLVRRWEEDVMRDLEQEPFSDAEFEPLLKKEGPNARAKVEASPLLAYGATALATLVAPGFIIYLQLGDGDIIIVDEDGKVRRPLARDERLIANETTSLCSREAAREFRSHVQQVGDGAPAPALILVSTDGYANSFRDESGFLQVGSDILDLIAEDGFDKVSTEIEGWLDEASRSGSGDDITLGLLCRSSALDPYRRTKAAAAAAAPPAPPVDGDPPQG